MPELFFADLVRETTTGSGTGALMLDGATPGHRRFADAVPPGTRFHYTVAGLSHEDEWEVGEGGIADGALASREALASSNGGGLVDFSPGVKIVTLTVAARWFADRDDRDAHDHAPDQIVGLQAALDAKQPAGEYAPAAHGHNITGITGLQAALDTKQAVGDYAAASHSHAIAGVSGLQAALDAKQPAGSYATADHGHSGLGLGAGSAAAPSLAFAADSDTGAFQPGTNTFAITTAGVERARFAADGRLGIGTTAPVGGVHVYWDGFNPTANTTGALVVDGSYGGGVLLKDGTGFAGLWTADYGNLLNIGLGSGNMAATLQIRQAGIYPAVDSALALGSASLRWSQLYAANGTINTSDARAKHWIGALQPAEVDAGQAILAELGQFQWLDARAAKGADGARVHFGLRAQNAFAVLANHGLDWHRYGWCCHDQWEDDEGAQERFGIRPDQLALFLISALARQVADLSAQLATQANNAGA